jgi:hypothetical protein
MEAVNKLLEVLSALGDSQAETIAKIVLLLLSAFGGIFWAIWKARARKKTATDQSQRDRSDIIRDNDRDETQNARDGQSVRDRLRGGKDE